jgi:RNA polymerase sigma-70 factor (ECF subfamily)
MIYCVVPPDVAPRVRRQVERALRDQPSVVLVEERRLADRRARQDRRALAAWSPEDVERRRIRYPEGRRVAERRATLVPVAGPPLPRRLDEHAERLTFLEGLETPVEFQEEIEAIRAIVRFQTGHREAFAELYQRWFSPIYTYMRVTLDDPGEADQRACAVFAEAAHELPRLSLGVSELRPWLFGLAYRVASDGCPLLPAARSEAAGGESDADAPIEDEVLAWLTDEELLLLIARRPVPERHAVVLRYLAGLGFAEIAEIMQIPRHRALALHRSALGALEAMLSAVSRSPRVGGRHPMSRLGGQTPVLYRRRRALLAA